MFKRLYGDNVLGKILNEAFRKLRDDYLVEQKEIQSSIPEREERLEKLKSPAANMSVLLYYRDIGLLGDLVEQSPENAVAPEPQEVA